VIRSPIPAISARRRHPRSGRSHQSCWWALAAAVNKSVVAGRIVQKKKFPHSEAYNSAEKNHRLFIELIPKMLVDSPEHRLDPLDALHYTFLQMEPQGPMGGHCRQLSSSYCPTICAPHRPMRIGRLLLRPDAAEKGTMMMMVLLLLLPLLLLLLRPARVGPVPTADSIDWRCSFWATSNLSEFVRQPMTQDVDPTTIQPIHIPVPNAAVESLNVLAVSGIVVTLERAR
jgi:hypothetical protein